ncbi:AAA family ATPase [Candidatus Pacearchaeota archaeon]|nr:AAA family ATPase [Candidatus Pacearchaeota archaeon]
MILKKIKLKNIRSYEQGEIDFSGGSTLLAGDVGSGKTSILLGIEFALFGLQPGQRGSSLLRSGEEEGEVMLEFEVDNKKIIIERTLKRKKTISQDFCAITINDERKEMSVTELKNKVLELLNYPAEFSKKQNILYKFTVYTPQEEMKQIILEDPETRINTLRHVFGIDKYKKILENISIITIKLREEKRINEGLVMNLEQDKLNLVEKETELETKQYNLTSVEKELFLKTEQRKRIQEEKEEISKKIEEKNKLQQEIEKTKIIINNKQDTILSNAKTIEKVKSQMKELQDLRFDEAKISYLEQEIILKKKEKQKLADKNLEVNSQMHSLILRIEDNQKLEKKLSNLEICPTCLQSVDSTYRANVLNKLHNDVSQINKTIEELEQEKENMSGKIIAIDGKISSAEKELTDLKILKIKLQQVQEKEKHISEIEKSNLMLEEDVKLLSQHTEILNSSIFELKKFDNISETKQKELDEALRQERIADIKVAELKKEIEVFSKQIDELKESIKKTEKIREHLNYITDVENWLSKQFITLISFIEKNVMIKLKAEFSNLFAEWFYMLVSDSFNIRLGDDFTPIIEQQDYEIDYAYLSGGERTAIALAYRLALNQVINSFLSKIKTRDLVILDEPTDGFSDQQLDKMRDILQQLNVKQLIIVSHEQKIEGFVENIIRIKKEAGRSVKI